jgi:hypothetical protein
MAANFGRHLLFHVHRVPNDARLRFAGNPKGSARVG